MEKDTKDKGAARKLLPESFDKDNKDETSASPLLAEND